MRSEAWRPAVAARNRSPREARDPALQALRPGCEELAARIRRQLLAVVRRRAPKGDGSAAPGAQNRHGGAPRGERPASWDARRLASAWPAASCAGPTGASHAPERFSALRPTLDSGSVKQRMQTPGAENAPREGGGIMQDVLPGRPCRPLVMRGLDPRIHLLRKKSLRRRMDCRVKPGNDSGVARSVLRPLDATNGCTK